MTVTPRSLGSMTPSQTPFSTVSAAPRRSEEEDRLLPCLSAHRTHPNPFFNSPKLEVIHAPQTDRVLMKAFSLEDKARALMEERVAQGLISFSDFEVSRATHFHEAQRKEQEAFGGSHGDSQSPHSPMTPRSGVATNLSPKRHGSSRSSHSPQSGGLSSGPIASQFVVLAPTDEEINKHSGYSESWVSRVAYTNRLLRLKKTLVQLRTIHDVEMTARTKVFIDQRKAHDVLVARYFRSFSESMRKIRQRHNRDTRNRIKEEDEGTVNKHSRTHLVQAPAPPQVKRPSTEVYLRRKRGSIDVSGVPLDGLDDECEPLLNPHATIDEIISSNSAVFSPNFSTRGGGGEASFGGFGARSNSRSMIRATSVVHASIGGSSDNNSVHHE